MGQISDISVQTDFSRSDIVRLLSASGKDEMNELFTAAYEVKKRHVGAVVYYRGLIELSNICGKNCLYCGIRRDNRDVRRYRMAEN